MQIPYMYCFSKHLVPKPPDWGRTIEITGAPPRCSESRVASGAHASSAPPTSNIADVLTWPGGASLPQCMRVRSQAVASSMQHAHCNTETEAASAAGPDSLCNARTPAACEPGACLPGTARPELARLAPVSRRAPAACRGPVCAVTRMRAAAAGFCFLDVAQRTGYAPPDDLRAFLAAGPAPVYFGWGSLMVDDPKVRAGRARR